MLVEARRGAHDGHDPIGVGKLEEAVDRLIAQTGGHVTQLLLGVELVLELGAPPPFVRRQ